MSVSDLATRLLDHLNHFLDWLIDRRHCPKDWNERSVAIRAKIQQSVGDMPEDEQIKRLLSSSCKNIERRRRRSLFFSRLDLDYFSSIQIVEILKTTERESKNMFGMYSSQRMKVCRRCDEHQEIDLVGPIV